MFLDECGGDRVSRASPLIRPPMTILIVTDQFPPKHFGGMAQHAWHLSRHLAGSHRVIVAVPKSLGKPADAHGLDVRPVLDVASPRRDANALLKLARAERCDVIHSCTAGLTPIPLSAEFPVVQRVVGNDFLRPWCGGNLPLRGVFYRIPMAAVRNAFARHERARRKVNVIAQLARCRTIAANSQWTAAALGREGIPADRIRTIVGGMDCSVFCPAEDRSALRASLGVQPHEFMIVTAGNFVPKKGFDTVLRAIALLGKHKAVIRYFAIGDGPQEANLRSLADTLELSRSVTFTGRMNQSRLTQYYQACDAYVQPSRDHAMGQQMTDVETMGRTFFEAGGCGAAVIGSSVGGIPDVIRPHDNGLLIGNPEDPAELANAIALLLENPEVRAQLGAAGIRRAHDEFSWDIVAARYDRELSQAISIQR
jgi:glycosyltransferase involved in cell wall biosynthesis